MHLPGVLMAALEQLAEGISLRELSACFEELSSGYREGKVGAQRGKEGLRLAYLYTRMPATYAAVCAVFQQIEPLLSGIKTMGDVGAGPGTASFAASAYLPHLERVLLYEQDPSFIAIGKKLGNFEEWRQEDFTRAEFPKRDLWIASYSLGELSLGEALCCAQKLWEATEGLLILVEPGTPRGFERILSIRSHLLSLGAYLAAPCPHEGACPMQKEGWCHFYVRVERSSFHRRMKGGSLPFEDEKFSYLVFSREKRERESRVIRQVEKEKGMVRLTICSPSGIHQIKTKKGEEQYKRVKKLDWGDSYRE